MASHPDRRYDLSVTGAAKKILEDARELDSMDRKMVAAELRQPAPARPSDEEWHAELESRIADVKRGDVVLENAEAIYDELVADIAR